MKIEGKLVAPSMIWNLGVKWVSASGFRISFAGLLGAAGLVLALRDDRLRNLNFPTWSLDRDSSSEQLLLVPGLRNLGNNCFLNVILQALASCSGFQDYMQSTMGECQSLLGEEFVESSPFMVTLTSLLEELGTLHHGRLVLSPRKLMLVMDHYISNFNLANQQDAEEAFLHILSSLRDEISSCYVQKCSSLADLTALPKSRILALESSVKQQTLQERWQRSFHGPFDGIIGSTLFCRSCSLQISLDFQFFHSLHISPVPSFSTSIIRPGCSLEDCLNQFFVEERLENFFCSHCWHGAALKYLSVVDENETDIEKLRRCCDYDSCDCRNLPRLRALPWSNSFSKTFKQLSIARSPKILCIHLQRASMNGFGDLVKLQGHVSFPFILNLNPFMKSEMVTKNLGKEFLVKQRNQFHPHPNTFHLQLNSSMLHGLYGKTGNIIPKTSSTEVSGQTAEETSGDPQPQQQTLEEEDPSIHQNGGCSDIKCHDTSVQSVHDKVGRGNNNLTPSGSPPNMYRLVSVVQHFGRAGSGHYTVYRRVTVKNNSDRLGLAGSTDVRWFCVSDSEVYVVSEDDVLAAEASLLFYEKIAEQL